MAIVSTKCRNKFVMSLEIMDCEWWRSCERETTDVRSEKLYQLLQLKTILHQNQICVRIMWYDVLTKCTRLYMLLLMLILLIELVWMSNAFDAPTTFWMCKWMCMSVPVHCTMSVPNVRHSFYLFIFTAFGKGF